MSREERTEQTRLDLLKAATDVFAEYGFHDATLQVIAERAGYSSASLHRHFGSKDALFLTAYEEFILARVAELDNIYVRERDAGSMAERARVFADHWTERQTDRPEFVIAALEFFVYALRHPTLKEAVATRRAAVRLALTRMLEQDARELGLDLPLPADEIALVLRELGVGLSLAKLTDPDLVRDELYGDFVELFFRQAVSDRSSTDG